MIWKKKQSDNPAKLTWDTAANTALEQALTQTPMPTMLKGTVKKELAKAAEQHARQQGHATVTAEDLMQGMLAKIPAHMKDKVEQAMKQGPESLNKLRDELS
jgi:hypothetical protein